MKASLKKLKDCKVKLTVEVGAQIVDERFEEVFRDFQRVAQIPGFREGRAPLEMIEKKFENEAKEQVLKSLIPEVYHQAVQQQKITPVSLPSISDIKLERGKCLMFSAEFEKEPEFSLKSYKGIKIKKVPANVQEEDVEKAMTSLLESRAQLLPLVEPRAVQKGDFIITDIEIWQDQKYKPGRKDVVLAVEFNEANDFYDKVLGAQTDDMREISADLTEEEKKQGLVGRKPLYKIRIKQIKEKKMPVLDDEFAKTFGKDTVPDLREAARKDIARYRQSESYEAMKVELFEKLITLANFEIPQGLVEKQKERLLAQASKQFLQAGGAESQFEIEKCKMDEEAALKANNQVKIYFILQKVAQAEDIQIDEEELERKLAALAQESKRPIEEARRVFEEDLRESMKESKTIDFLLANAKLEETS